MVYPDGLDHRIFVLRRHKQHAQLDDRRNLQEKPRRKNGLRHANLHLHVHRSVSGQSDFLHHCICDLRADFLERLPLDDSAVRHVRAHGRGCRTDNGNRVFPHRLQNHAEMETAEHRQRISDTIRKGLRI